MEHILPDLSKDSSKGLKQFPLDVRAVSAIKKVTNEMLIAQKYPSLVLSLFL